MSFIGSFGMFTTVRLGIYTSQKGLNLTGNNIANINTEGYTRQTLNIKSMNASGVDRYSDSNVRIGSGAYVTGLSQMRDPYLDIRYRTECASVGYMDTKLSNLNDIAAILDEVGDGEDANGVIIAQLGDLTAALENLTEYTGQGEFDTQVRSAASSLISMFNSYASKLEEVEVNAVDRFEKDLVTVNELLNNIRNLSTAIRTSDIHGAPSLESRDERNRLIDELSQYIKIDVEYTTENIGPAVDVEKLSIKLAGTYPGVYLLDGIYGVNLYQRDLNPAHEINPTQPPYLDKDGNPTYTSNFDLNMTALTDNKGNIKTTYNGIERKEVYAGMKVIDENGNEIDIQEKINALIDNRISWNTPADDDGNQTQYLLRKITKEAEDGTISTSYLLTETKIQLSTEIELGDNALYGGLQATREFLTEEGEFATNDYIATVDPDAATKRGVRYYRKALDLLARKFAESMNTANNDFRYTYDVDDKKYYYVDKDGKRITYPDGSGSYMEKMQLLSDTELRQLQVDDPTAYQEYMDKIAHLESKGSRAKNYGNLFSVRGDCNDVVTADGEGITASNISISAAWAKGDVQLVNSYSVIPGTNQIGTTDNTNILHLVHLMDKDMTYTPAELVDGTKDDSMFHGSFSEMLGNINAVLGNDQNSTQIMLDNYYTSAVELDTSRDSVSSVDLNDETVNMIQYQKSYSAACRLMTTMDEILDKLINGTGVAGR